MSEHRRKPPQPQGGGRAAARRAAQQSSGRRAASGHPASGAGAPHGSYGEEPAYGSRAEARRAAQRGGGRRRGAATAAGGPPGKKRLIDYPRAGKHGWRHWTPSWKLVGGLFLGFVGSLLGASVIAYAWVDLPNMANTAKAQNNVYYWSDDSQMAATGGEINRQNLKYEDIPKAMQNAVISAENKSFWDDWGVDPKGIGRAFYNMATGGDTQGGSTITQQYVKNAMLDDRSQTVSRKAKELFISLKVGQKVSKEEVMAGYLNTSYYGRGAYGLQAAARTYYSKSADELDASECAFLAGLLKGSTYYDPAGAPEIDPKGATPEANTKRATERWSWILGQMVQDGSLKATDRAKFTKFPMPKPPKKEAKLGGQIGYLVDLAKANFINSNGQGITAKDLAEGGYEIHTTFDKKKVKLLEQSVQKVYDKHIDPEKRPDTDTHVQFGGASIDPRTGAIAAIYGGQDATKHFTNNADKTGAAVGSTFKPFVLAAAMRDGVRDPAGGPEQGPESRKIIDPDTAIYNGDNKLKIKNFDGSVWHDENGKEWLQANDEKKNYGPIDLREAMVHSANSPFVQLGMDIGIKQVRQAAMDAGLREDSLIGADVPSFSIGISDPSAIRMAGAYATFAANGKQREPYSVTKVEKLGEVVYQHDDSGARQPFSSAVASNVTDVLRDVVKEGTGTNAAIPGRPVAGKTGTTDGNKSAWFVGYTPQLATAIDMYRLDDDASNKKRQFEEMFGTGDQPKIHGSSFPSQIFQSYMSAALKGEKVIQFPEPEDLDADSFYGGGAKSPDPTPSKEEPSTSPSPSDSPSTSPSPTPSKEPSEEPSSPEPTDDCDPFDPTCDDGDNGGGDPNGGQDGGAIDGGATDGQSDGGATDGGTIDGQTGGQPNGGQANGGQVNGGQANGGQANGGQANGGQANGGQANGGQANGGWLGGRDG
ncbi:transglycosylase domain-containing protein [Streptomyces lichenis]|uniref:Transglycosylase domain-containing protein n=1 Tax=Streptomyces lichenis TaxID=2306967 RepID=A0ABT0I4S3_9ACTN|nr:transglycosylase domain-containing protein [Streptomyces lichenis]MCK8676308.1 transglycosylase domain-containing protein [Streptomyces lichenis]